LHGLDDVRLAGYVENKFWLAQLIVFNLFNHLNRPFVLSKEKINASTV